ncbi:MAG: Fe-S-containing protein [Eubacteriales bacterium]|nr:Fe-S-containing protein [Eubacteriales bacterium]
MIEILKYLVLTTYDLTELLLFTGVLTALFLHEKRKSAKWMLTGGWLVGWCGAIAQFVLKTLYPKKMNIQLNRIHRWTTVLAGLFFMLLFIWLIIEFRNKKKSAKMIAVRNGLATVTSAFLIMRVGPGLIRYTTEFVYFGEKTISTMSLMRSIGYALGIGVTVLGFFAVRHLCKKESHRFAKSVFLLLTLVISLHYVMLAIGDAAKLRLIPVKKVFHILGWGVSFNYYSVFISVIICLIAALIVIIRNRKVVGSFANSALYRKERARLRNKRRWSYFTGALAISVILIGTVVKAYDEREEQATPPEQVEETDSEVIVPLSMVEDGHLHRFAIKGPNGNQIKFLVVRKPQGNAYGLGLDACEICGVAGYIERKDEVVCKKCDVVMNKATIGFKGGCNPIPFDYEIKDATIRIQKETLYKFEHIFR